MVHTLRLLLSTILLAVSVAGQQEPFYAKAESSNISPDFDINALRLVQFSLDEDPIWMTEGTKLDVKRAGQTFFDITDHPNLGEGPTKPRFIYPKAPNATAIVHEILPLTNKTNLEETLRHFSSYKTRYYNSFTGKASSEWLLEKIQNYTIEYAKKEVLELIEVKPVRHPWLQTSIIIRIAPKGSKLTDPTTVVGAHCDSINIIDPFLPAPGADDDGSGTVTILEAYRAILESGYTPVSPLEFHFYAAEEGGLLGSQAIVASFELGGRPVKGMQQYDMTAWIKANTTESINVMTTVVDHDLTEFQKRLIEEYVGLPWTESHYPGTAASDHGSWTKGGYQACHVTEARFEEMNPNVHTPHDSIDASDIDEFSFDHMLNYVKLAISFAVELSSY